MGKHKIFLALALLCLLPPLICGLISPYPLNDDSLYAWSINELSQRGRLIFLSTTPSCFLHVLLGAVVWKIFGPNFAILHFLSLGWIFAIATAVYQILQSLSLRRADAALAAMLVLVNPIVLNLSICYMTDLPAMAFSSWCMYFCLQGLKTGSRRSWLLCVVMLCLSLLCRQTNVFMLLALIAVSIVLIFRKERHDGIFLVLLLPVPALVYLFAEQYISSHTVYTYPMQSYKAKLLEAASWLAASGLEGCRYFILSAAKTACYVGVYLLPVVLPAVLALLLRRKALSLIVIALLGAAVLTAMPLGLALMQNQLMPYAFSMIAPPFVGCYNIFQFQWVNEVWDEQKLFCLTLACDVLAFFLSALVWFKIELAFIGLTRKKPAGIAVPRILFLLFTLFLIAANGALLVLQSRVINFDRYNIVLLVPALIVCGYAWRFSPPPRFLRYLGWALAALLFVYSNVALVDISNFNACRWSLIRTLEKGGVNSREIDGGPEFNLLVNPDLFAKEMKGNKDFIDVWEPRYRGGEEQGLFRWWPVSGSEYIIANQEFPHYKSVAEQKYFSPLEWRWKSMHVLKKS